MHSIYVFVMQISLLVYSQPSDIFNFIWNLSELFSELFRSAATLFDLLCALPDQLSIVDVQLFLSFDCLDSIIVRLLVRLKLLNLSVCLVSLFDKFLLRFHEVCYDLLRHVIFFLQFLVLLNELQNLSDYLFMVNLLFGSFFVHLFLNRFITVLLFLLKLGVFLI